MKAFEGEEERVYVVTLSAELSGSYNSAVLGKNLFLEEHGQKDIYIFNSRSYARSPVIPEQNTYFVRRYMSPPH